MKIHFGEKGINTGQNISLQSILRLEDYIIHLATIKIEM